MPLPLPSRPPPRHYKFPNNGAVFPLINRDNRAKEKSLAPIMNMGAAPDREEEEEEEVHEDRSCVEFEVA